ncbi:MAG TPA: Fe-S cluster assembly protein SufD [Actinomycetes bacterium]|nr:Fe-S cluster assembly protein SufD [Actinomycetes bacterium]
MPTGQKLPTVEVSGHSHGAGADGERAVSKLHAFASRDVADFPVPHGREEEWRFTPLNRLRGLHDGSAAATGKVLVEVDAPAGVPVATAERDDPRVGRAGVPSDRVAAAAWTYAETATVITVPAETAPDRPITVRLHGEAAQGPAYGHLVVEVEPLSEAVVVLDHTGSATYADNVEIVVGDGAKLTLVSVQDWADDAVHLSHHFISVGRDASVRSVVVTFGGDLVRIYPQVSYAGPNGEAELLGLYFADAGQHLEHRLFVDHSAPHCRSRVAYKGALQGDGAHTVWIGDVLIRKTAIGTDTYELNRNLVLTDGARADSVPNLEIETGEVEGAGHASATGRFDDEQLFYLQSRGIRAEEARRLVVRGFFAELITRIGVPAVEERLIAAVETELEGAVA